MDSKQRYKVIGLMSGTSLDGLDIAYCVFTKNKNGWRYEIRKTTTLKYPESWRENLATAHTFSAQRLIGLDAAYGKFLGTTCASFIRKHNLAVDFIASHGHTIFHQPEKAFTFQLGNGHALHAAAELPVVYDFRSLDIARGGQGAPLVPIGDKLLFSEYDVCLNLGGIANLSAEIKGKRTAFDICFMNMGLNYLAEKTGRSYDAGGALADSGDVNTNVTQALAKIYSRIKRKRPSLGRELFEEQIRPILDQQKIPLNDRLRSSVESSAREIAEAILSVKKNPNVLCTGGGAFNSFFMSTLLDVCGDDARLVIPDESVVKFKEALVFAFLGILRVRGEVNCLKSVTGATRNSSSGILIGF